LTIPVTDEIQKKGRSLKFKIPQPPFPKGEEDWDFIDSLLIRSLK
jgi:hypothetical protein